MGRTLSTKDDIDIIGLELIKEYNDILKLIQMLEDSRDSSTSRNIVDMYDEMILHEKQELYKILLSIHNNPTLRKIFE